MITVPYENKTSCVLVSVKGWSFARRRFSRAQRCDRWQASGGDLAVWYCTDRRWGKDLLTLLQITTPPTTALCHTATFHGGHFITHIFCIHGLCTSILARWHVWQCYYISETTDGAVSLPAPSQVSLSVLILLWGSASWRHIFRRILTVQFLI